MILLLDRLNLYQLWPNDRHISQILV